MRCCLFFRSFFLSLFFLRLLAFSHWLVYCALILVFAFCTFVFFIASQLITNWKFKIIYAYTHPHESASLPEQQRSICEIILYSWTIWASRKCVEEGTNSEPLFTAYDLVYDFYFVFGFVFAHAHKLHLSFLFESDCFSSIERRDHVQAILTIIWKRKLRWRQPPQFSFPYETYRFGETIEKSSNIIPFALFIIHQINSFLPSSEPEEDEEKQRNQHRQMLRVFIFIHYYWKLFICTCSQICLKSVSQVTSIHGTRTV